MTLHVQLYGTTFDVLRTYVGPARELTVDTTNWDLLLQDGVTPGGLRFASIANLDTRYQAKSSELDGFDFSAAAFGVVVRKTPGSYALRTLKVAVESLSLSNGSGVNGDPTFALAETITSTHTFNQPLTGAGGFVGDLTGNSTGIHTGDTHGTHVGPVTGDVTGDLIGQTEGNHTGGIDTRGADVFFDDGQIPLAALSTETQQMFIDRGIPMGGIIMWSGVVAAIPAGWFLCDGTNGTPNLVNRFIVGSTDLYAHLATGGSVDHTHTVTNPAAGAHTHALTVATHILVEAELPAHKHGNGVTCATSNVFNHSTTPAVPTTGKSIDENGATGGTEGYTTTIGSGTAHGHTGSTADSDGSHTHTTSVDTVSNLPPYFALAYIMKGV